MRNVFEGCDAAVRKKIAGDSFTNRVPLKTRSAALIYCSARDLVWREGSISLQGQPLSLRASTTIRVTFRHFVAHAAVRAALVLSQLGNHS